MGVAVGSSLPETLATLVRACLTCPLSLVVLPDVYKSSDRGRCAARRRPAPAREPAACIMHACRQAPALPIWLLLTTRDLAPSDVGLHAVT